MCSSQSISAVRLLRRPPQTTASPSPHLGFGVPSHPKALLQEGNLLTHWAALPGLWEVVQARDSPELRHTCKQACTCPLQESHSCTQEPPQEHLGPSFLQGQGSRNANTCPCCPPGCQRSVTPGTGALAGSGGNARWGWLLGRPWPISHPLAPTPL